MKNKWKYPERADSMHFTKKNQQKVLNEIDSPPQKKKPGKRFYAGLTVAILVMLLIGGTVFTQDIETVLAKIPYISQFIKEEEQRNEKMESILDKVNLVVEENGMELGDLQIHVDEKEVKVHIRGLTENNKSISNQIESQFEKSGFTSYDVKVVAYEEPEKIQTERRKAELEEDMQDSEALKTTLKKRLKSQEYELMFPISVRINNLEGVYINVIVPESENRLEQLKEIVKKEAEAYGDEYKLDVRQVQKTARQQEIRWGKTRAIEHIGRALMEANDLHVTTYSYSFHPYPLQLKIKTSLDSDNPKASEIAKEIHSEIDLFIQSSEDTQTIRDDRYNVIVLSKDKKEIKVE
ncbi:DUF4030 domain-containing protein [Virgibacillus flavescens]|uniref:DUF4030 domain-containing protein n=1 Tax=Virgibacillus flavescens TaxID=1611422 RepID=UPI003D32B133